jgi:hypothetical protein
MKIDAECTWGDGPDVLLIIGKLFVDLKKEEALDLAYKLISASEQAKEMDNMGDIT